VEGTEIDSDYWSAGNGDMDFVDILISNSLNKSDWIELKDDLKNWSTFQLEIFTLCLFSWQDEIIIERMSLIPELIKIAKTRKNESIDIINIIIENTDILKIFSKNMPYDLMNKIASEMNYYNYLNDNIMKDSDFVKDFEYALRNTIN